MPSTFSGLFVPTAARESPESAEPRSDRDTTPEEQEESTSPARLARRSGAGSVGCSAARDKERKEATLVELDIIYKYFAPEDSPRDAIPIKTATMEVEDNEIWTNPHPVGEVISLRADAPDEHREQPKEYRVVERAPVMAPTRDSGYSMTALTVVVTDP
jgi:hypothetical protein